MSRIFSLLLLMISRSCFKNASYKIRITIYGGFCLNEGGIAGYGNRMKAKYTANWDIQIAGIFFNALILHIITAIKNFQKPTSHHNIFSYYYYNKNQKLFLRLERRTYFLHRHFLQERRQLNLDLPR